ncbi:MAG: tRNA pseudouridine(38-40) synthase TruA [Oscillospiraceae bacterium]|nr:tRNA pseudouridine(38-40) synthase TruA [Oscillospiraceae bacterium]
MKNYKLTIAYDGTRYRGWQSQGNTEQTIQGKLQALFSRLAGRETEVHGSGRTDAGVHARGQVANVKLDTAMTCQELKEYCNHYLPEDIGILDVTEAPERFHARLNAKTKCYVYRIWNSSEPCIFERRYVTRIPQPLDAEAMERAAGYLTGTHDFRSFCGLRRFKKSTVRTIYSIDIRRIGQELRITYVGNGFLNLMVRILTGTLVEVGLGQRPPESMPEVLAALDRDAAGKTMPPTGLCLEYVTY